MLYFLTLNKAGLFEGIFFWEGVNSTPPPIPIPHLFIFQEEQIQCRYNFM